MTIGAAARDFGRLIGVLITLALLLSANYLFAERYLVRLDWPQDPFKDIPRHLTSIASPVVLATGGYGRDAAVVQRFVATIGLASHPLPENSDHLIPIDYVARANPYPQPHDVVWSREVSFLSFGYVGMDERYHQVTYYWGEADTTPSLLVRKVRGAATGWGDYFVRYTVFLSKDLKPHPASIDSRTGEVTRWEHPSKWPDVDRVDWSTYRGGSYDGFEEVGFALMASVCEALAAVFVWMRLSSRRPSNGQVQPVSGT